MTNNRINRSNETRNTRRQKKRKSKTVLRKIKKKIAIVFFLVGLLFFALATKIFLINHEDGDKYSKQVLDHQQYTSTVLPYKRGQIIDRNGTILAYSEKVYNLILDPKIILSDDQYKEPTLNALIKCFDLKIEDLENIIATKPDSHYEKLLKNLTGDQIAAFKELIADTEKNPNIKGAWFEDSYVRKYPFSSLACDALGFATPSTGGEIGLESYYNENLSGTDGVTYGYVDENLDIEKTTKDPIDGDNIITTIDFSVQSIIEKHLKAFNTTYGSKNSAIIVMNPNNGEILGMASYPVFDLNNPRDLTGQYTADQLAKMSDQDTNTALYSLWSNFSVSNIFEPGSTFKPFTVTAALEQNAITTSDTFICKGYQEVTATNSIKCWLTSGHGTETLEQTLMNSCNPAMMQIAAKLGAASFSDYQARFGFGQKTGIDLPSEEAGIVKPADMSAVDLASNAFGQNFDVNMVQMVAGFSSLINGGNYYLPHIVKRVEKNNGQVVKSIDSTLVRQTITKSTSDTIKQYLKATVDEGTAKKAKIQGYSIGGKTGTAEKYPRGNDKYVISFMGFAPAENPKFIIYVVIDEPSVSKAEIGSSAPVVTLSNQVLADLLPYMNVFNDTDDAPVDANNGPVEAYSSSPLN